MRRVSGLVSEDAEYLCNPVENRGPESSDPALETIVCAAVATVAIVWNLASQTHNRIETSITS